MSQFIDILTVTVPATTGVFDAYDLVSFAGAKVITEDAPVLGMAKLPNTVIGDPAAVMALGVGRGKAVGVVTVGAKLVSAVGGGIKVAGATPANVFATALSAAADGEFFTYMIR